MAFFGQLPPLTVRARVLEVDGKLAGIAGYWMAGDQAVVFSDIAEDVTIPKLRIMREGLAFMKELDVPARCLADEGSGAFLTRLGWEHIGTSDEGEVYQWQC